MLEMILILPVAVFLLSGAVVVLCAAACLMGFEGELHDWISGRMKRRKEGKDD